MSDRREAAARSPGAANSGTPPGPADDRERVILLECRLEQMRSALSAARGDADAARTKLADSCAREADHARRYGMIHAELAEARAEIAVLHRRLERSEALKAEIEGYLFEAGSRADTDELTRLRTKVLVEEQRSLVNDRTLARLRLRVEDLAATRETLLTRVAEWQQLIRKEGPDAADLSEFLAELRSEILELEHRNLTGDARETVLRERLAMAGIDPDRDPADDVRGVQILADESIDQDEPADEDDPVGQNTSVATEEPANGSRPVRKPEPVRGERPAGKPEPVREDPPVETPEPIQTEEPVAPIEAEATAEDSAQTEPAASAEDPIVATSPEAPAETAAHEPTDAHEPPAGPRQSGSSLGGGTTEGIVPGPSRTDQLIADLMAAENPARRADLLLRLGRGGDARAHKMIGPWTKSLEPSVRAAAYEALGRLLERSPDLLEPHLRAGLADTDARVRRRVALAAATARGLTPRLLLEPLKEDPDAQVRRVVREVLRQAPSGRALDVPSEGTPHESNGESPSISNRSSRAR